MIDDPFDLASIALYHNPSASPESAYPEALQGVLSRADCDTARDVIRQWDDYQPSPLRSLDGLAANLGIANLYYKDESRRFGLGSFKALGGAYAVRQVLQGEMATWTGETGGAPSRHSGIDTDRLQEITVVTATDGNHGRSVAWGAQRFGCKCVIYMHAGVSQGRAKAVEALGATVVWVDGNYDDAVRQAAIDAAIQGWFVVSDTSYAGYTDVPRQVMAGYTVMTAELSAQLPADRAPSHVFVQGRVGGLAGAVCAHLWQILGVTSQRPRCVIVEPDRADCLFQSAMHGEPTSVHIVRETIMAGLSCGEVSQLGWQILHAAAHDFMTISDDLIAPSMRLLADGVGGDIPVVAGESGVAGLAALIAVQRQPALSQALGLDGSSRVLVFGTEGATDPDIYQSLVGRPPRCRYR